MRRVTQTEAQNYTGFQPVLAAKRDKDNSLCEMPKISVYLHCSHWSAVKLPSSTKFPSTFLGLA